MIHPTNISPSRRTGCITRILRYVSAALGPDARRRKVYNTDGNLDPAALYRLLLEASSTEDTPMDDFIREHLPERFAPLLEEYLRIGKLLSAPVHKDAPSGLLEGGLDRTAGEAIWNKLRTDALLEASMAFLDKKTGRIR